MCIMVENEEDVAAFKDYQPPADEATPTPPPPPAQEAASQPPPPAATPSPPPPSTTTPPPAPAAARGTAGRVFASPYARTLAAEQGVDLQVSFSTCVWRIQHVCSIFRVTLSNLSDFVIVFLHNIYLGNRP